MSYAVLDVKRIHRNRIAKRHDGDTFEYLRDVVAERVVDRLEVNNSISKIFD